MAETKNGALSVENTTEMVEQLRKSFDEMESHRECLSHEKILLEDIKQHFDNIKKSLQQKFDEIETKERAFEEKKAEYHALLAEREASANAKEQDLFDHLQGLKDVAVSAIFEAHKKYKATLENKVSTSAYDDPNSSTSAPGENISFNKSSSALDTPFKVKLRLQVKQLCEQMNSKGLVKCISDNRKTLVTMPDVLTDALRGAKEPAHLVLNAIEAFYPQNQFDSSRQSSKDNNLQYLRRTCSQLLESAAPLLGMVEPGSDNLLSSEFKQRAKIIADEWKAKLAIMNLDASNGYSLEALSFLQLLVTFSISSEFDEDELCKLVISVSRHRNQAPKLCRVLGLAHKTQDVVQALVNKGRQIDAALFSHAFQLTEIFPLVPLLKQYLEDMKKNFSQIEATGTELHSTKNYRSNYYTPFQRDTANQELGALKAVIKCIEEYKLHEEYPPDPLHQRVAEIEKAKADKKRTVEAAPAQVMKPWADGGYAPPKVPVDIDIRLKPSTVYDERVRYYGSGANRHLYAAPPAYAVSGRSGDNRYPCTAPPAYEASGHSVDNSYPYYSAPPAFVVSGHTPYGLQSSAPRPYHYQDDRVPLSHASDYRAPHGSLSNFGSYVSPPVQSTPGNYVNYMNSGMQQPTTSSNYGNHTISSLQSSHQSYM